MSLYGKILVAMSMLTLVGCNTARPPQPDWLKPPPVNAQTTARPATTAAPTVVTPPNEEEWIAGAQARTKTYFELIDGGKYDDAYFYFENRAKLAIPYKDFFSHQTSQPARKIENLQFSGGTIYKDPNSGIKVYNPATRQISVFKSSSYTERFVAVDFIVEYTDGTFGCGYQVWHGVSPHGLQLVRIELSHLDVSRDRLPDAAVAARCKV